MNNGVIYYNRGNSCVLRLIVSIKSLRKYYNGNITLLLEGCDLNQFSEFIQSNDISIVNLDTDTCNNSYVRKIIVSQLSPYDKTIFIDADTLIVGNIDEIFDDIENHDLVVTKFSNWVSSGRTISSRINKFSKYLSEEDLQKAINYGPAINTGVYGFKKNSKIFDEWIKLAKIGQNNNIYIPDEVACQALLHKYNVKIIDAKFNVSAKYGENEQDKRIIHYHGRKHCKKFKLSEYWILEFIEILKNNIIDKNNINHDYHLNKFLQYKYGWNNYVDECLSLLSQNDNDEYPNYTNTTIVTACDPKYVECLKVTFPTWIKYKNILKFSIIVYINGLQENDSRLAFLRNHKNIRLIQWEMQNADSHREKMLSAFVFGPARDVKTKYWLKLDADAYAIDSREILDKSMGLYDIVGHKWSYTKPTEWINILNNWSCDKKLNFQYPIDKSKISNNKYYHHRTNSFIQLHSTEFTKQAAELADGRLPIPSQDTYLWYVASALNKKIYRYDFKRKCGIYNKKTTEQIKNAIQQDNIIKLHIGCGKKNYNGWINTDKHILDVTDEKSWNNNNILYGSVHRILAEHVFEHLNSSDRIKAIINFKRFIHKDGLIRIAVPDGYHPDKNYIQQVCVNGIGKSAHDHKFLYNYKNLIELFNKYDFVYDLLEYFDENKNFHFKSWDIADGFIKRSSRFDKRNRKKDLSYTSLIVDFKLKT